jgi:AhpD family alkylhydroperoxidase
MAIETGEPACSLVDRGKPTFTIAGFLVAVGASLRGLPVLLGSYLPPDRLDPQLREEVMVAVSRMNRCRHCTAIHSAWATLVGLSDEDLARLEAIDPERFDRREWLAVQYGRCVVAGDDGRALEEELRRHYSDREIAQIAAVARAIDVANQLGNTWDAFEGRLLGLPAGPGSSLLDELVVLGLVAPAGGPFLLVSKAVRTLRGQPAFEG